MVLRQRFFVQETIMGKTLHNKIYLGRSPVAVLNNKRVQAAIGMATLAGAGLAWLALRMLK
jgi:hypothetical protein